MRAAGRVLGVLAQLNRTNGATVTELARATGVSRPALYRVLQALGALGYVRRRDDRDEYELTALVRSLSDGFREEDWLRTVARPLLKELQREVIWPTNLTTFHGNQMLLRETTRPASPMTIDGVTVGLRLPMLHSAAGRAYLAWCPARERDLILANLRASANPADAIARDRRWVREVLATTRQRGYGEREEEGFERTGAIVVPVLEGGRVLACVGITFMLAALNPQQAARKYLAHLQRCADAIAAGVPARLTRA